MIATRTNISIEDKTAWDYVKMRKNQYNSKTISTELFRMINLYKQSQIDIDIVNFLILMEKFYELYSFSLKDVQEELQIGQKTHLDLVKKYLGDVKVYGNLSEEDISYAHRKIHDIMTRFHIQPHEYFLLQKLKTLFEYDDLTDKQNIIAMLYTNIQQRQAEIYNCIIVFLDEALEKKKDLNTFGKYWGVFSKYDPQFMYYKYGIEISKEDYEDDIISDILHESLKASDVYPCYNFLIEFAVSHLIQRNFQLMKDYITQDYLISDILIPKIEKVIKNFEFNWE